MDETHDKILTILQGVAQSKEPIAIGPDASLFDAGVLDSFRLLDLVLALEETFGLKIPDADLTAQKFESVNRIAAYVQSRA
jgi:D-alanine--poly(phosphoribitol) ligase subunit 2